MRSYPAVVLKAFEPSGFGICRLLLGLGVAVMGRRMVAPISRFESLNRFSFSRIGWESHLCSRVTLMRPKAMWFHSATKGHDKVVPNPFILNVW